MFMGHGFHNYFQSSEGMHVEIQSSHMQRGNEKCIDDIKKNMVIAYHLYTSTLLHIIASHCQILCGNFQRYVHILDNPGRFYHLFGFL